MTWFWNADERRHEIKCSECGTAYPVMDGHVAWVPSDYYCELCLFDRKERMDKDRVRNDRRKPLSDAERD